MPLSGTIISLRGNITMPAISDTSAIKMINEARHELLFS